MKTLLILCALLTTPTWASWEKIISCDGDMLVVDRKENLSGSFDYQTVFRRELVASMMNQNLVGENQLNAEGEIVRSSGATSGMLSESPRIGFQLSSLYRGPGVTSVIFVHRGGMAGNYSFNKCWFKYPVDQLN